jgi:hypothetical protein
VRAIAQLDDCGALQKRVGECIILGFGCRGLVKEDQDCILLLIAPCVPPAMKVHVLKLKEFGKASESVEQPSVYIVIILIRGIQDQIEITYWGFRQVLASSLRSWRNPGHVTVSGNKVFRALG